MDPFAHLLRGVASELAAEDVAKAAREVALARARDEERARRFLETLNPDSQEGMWFDAFAESYASRQDAAVAYVRGMSE